MKLTEQIQNSHDARPARAIITGEAGQISPQISCARAPLAAPNSTAPYLDPALARFAAHLPAKLRYGLNKVTATWADRDTAVRLGRYTELPSHQANYLILDIDHDGSAFWWRDQELPQPTITVINPENGHSLLFWELAAPVCLTAKGRKHPREYLEAIHAAYAAKLCADRSYAVNPFNCKSPCHPGWRVLTADVRYELGDLAEYVTLPSRKRVYHDRRKLKAEDADSPNGYLFLSGRAWGFAHVKGFTSEKDFTAALVERQLEQNAGGVVERFGKSLSPSNVKAQAMKVAGYVWQRRNKPRRESWNVGALGLGPVCPNLPPEDRLAEQRARRAAGGCFGARRRKDANGDRIARAYRELVAQGKRPSKVAIAKLTGLSRETVRKHLGA